MGPIYSERLTMNACKNLKPFGYLILITLMLAACGTGNIYVSRDLKVKGTKKCALAGFLFKDMKGEKDFRHISEEFSDALSIYFLQSGFSVIERSRIDLILKELNLQQTGITNSADAVKVGKLANVRYVVFGTGRLDRTGSSYFLHGVTVKMIDVESGEIVLMASRTGAGERPIEVANKMGYDIRLQFKLK